MTDLMIGIVMGFAVAVLLGRLLYVFLRWLFKSRPW